MALRRSTQINLKVRRDSSPRVLREEFRKTRKAHKVLRLDSPKGRRADSHKVLRVASRQVFRVDTRKEHKAASCQVFRLDTRKEGKADSRKEVKVDILKEVREASPKVLKTNSREALKGSFRRIKESHKTSQLKILHKDHPTRAKEIQVRQVEIQIRKRVRTLSRAVCLLEMVCR